MDELFTSFDAAFFERTRLSIMIIIRKEGKVSFNRLKELLGGSDGGIYSHLEKLGKAGYLEKKREIAGVSVQTVYSLTERGKETLTRYFAFMQAMIETSRDL